LLIARGGHCVIVSEQLVRAVDQVDFQGVASRTTLSDWDWLDQLATGPGVDPVRRK
jgi:hypothetical protein